MTTASRSGFLLYLNVKLVPIFAYFLLGRIITRDTWISAFVAFAGTMLLSFDGSPPNWGDLWSIFAAAASAMFILRLEGAAQLWSAEYSRELNSAILWVTTVLCGVWAGVESMIHQGGPNAMQEVVMEDWKQILYLGIICSAFCNWIQTVGQRSVPAEKAALIYAMDPVYGAIFARLLLGQSEALGIQGYIGGIMVTGAAIWATITAAPKKNDDVTEPNTPPVSDETTPTLLSAQNSTGSTSSKGSFHNDVEMVRRHSNR